MSTPPHAHHHPLSSSTLRLATSATLHCLFGCGLGEIVGDVLGTALNWSNTATILAALILGVVGGFGLGIVPYRRRRIPLPQALRAVLVTEGISIAVMELTEAAVQVFTPGLMNMTLSQPMYWIGMLAALSAGFLAAWPVNYLLVRRGVRHLH